MIEIIVAIILQITTILGGGTPDTNKAEETTKEKKAKTEQNSNANADGGQTGWEG